MSAPNIINVTSIIGKTIPILSVSTSGSTIIDAVPTSHVYKLNSVIASNKSTACSVSIVLTRSSVDYRIANNVNIPVSSSLFVIAKDTGLYLEEADVLKAISQYSSSIDIVASYEDIS